MSVSGINAYSAQDPYLIAALQSPNMNQIMQAQQTQQTSTNTATGQTPTINQNDVSFKGASENITETGKKKSNAAKWIFAGITAAALAFGAYKCHGKGIGEKWYGKIWDGAKKYWNQGIEAVSKWKFKSEVAGLLPAPTVEKNGLRISSSDGKNITDIIRISDGKIFDSRTFDNAPALKAEILKGLGIVA